MNRRIALGRWGENYAAGYLQERGYAILTRNFRTAHGEIDLVAQHGERLVFVEVKTRSSVAFGYPEEAVTPHKRRHLQAAALLYIEEQDWDGDWQIDVIAIISAESAANPRLEHFENI